MRGVPSPIPTKQRAAPRGSLARHRPRPLVQSRVPPDPGRMRLSDIVLALVGIALLAGLALMAVAALVSRAGPA